MSQVREREKVVVDHETVRKWIAASPILASVASEPGQLDYPPMPEGFDEKLWYRFNDLRGMINTGVDFASEDGLKLTLGLLLVLALVEGYLYGIDDLRGLLGEYGTMPPEAVLGKERPMKSRWSV